MNNIIFANHPIWFEIYKRNQKYLKSKGLKRIGKCNNCGECCRTIVVRINLKKAIYQIKRIKGEDCKSYNVVKKKCSNYLERPLLCRMFPLRPSDLKFTPHCSYKFVKVKK